MAAFHLHITGRVQGVGFRPFVYKLAVSKSIRGTVQNGLDGVHIYYQVPDEQAARNFYDEILKSAPSLAQIKQHNLTKVHDLDFQDFRIITSEKTGNVDLHLTPDIAICDNCRDEMNDPSNRRYHYPFITCTHCGPRYSIMHSLPYDRANTTMDPFLFCDNCSGEYEDWLNRRHYSQTNSCPDCPVSLSLFDNGKALLSSDSEKIILFIRKALVEGKIIAVKGIGGFLLLAHACMSETITALRNRKERSRKPFAVMYADMKSAEQDVHLNQDARRMLKSPESPIVVSPLKTDPGSGICSDLIAPDLDQLGVMLPYTGLFDLILRDLGFPIIATSGNVSDTPIVFENDSALEDLSSLADFIVTHDREIVIPIDDSVVRYTVQSGQKIIMRRARGYAPAMSGHPFGNLDASFLAMGAQLKSTFSIFQNDDLFMSQYLGNHEDFFSQESYKHTLNENLRLLECRPTKIFVDAHPDYFPTRMGEEISIPHDIPVQKIYHHRAHFAAILGEHSLVETREPVMGVIWDGTGFGEDGQIWGGEFFKYENKSFDRIGHLAYFDHLFGDKMAKEPRVSALSLAKKDLKCQKTLKRKFSVIEWKVYRQYLKKESSLQTSSMGRLFDGIASLLNLTDKNSFEGEAGMRLEQVATDYMRICHTLPAPYLEDTDYHSVLPVYKLFSEIHLDLEAKKSIGYIALKFHVTLVRLIQRIASDFAFTKIAFSGGVFLNAFLVDLIITSLSREYKLYFHQAMSPNDENISFGQLVCGFISDLKVKDKGFETLTTLKAV